MKILYMAMDSTTYLAPSHEVLVAEEMAKLGHKIFLVCERVPFGYDKVVPENISFRVMPINSVLSDDDFNELLKEKYDIAFCSSFPGTKWVNKIAKLQGIKSVSQVLDVPIFRLKFKHWHDIWMNNVQELKGTDVIVGNIEVTKQLLSSLSNGELEPKIKTIYYGIATENADRIPEQPKQDYIVWVSGIRWYKGLDLLLYALRCMQNPLKLKVIGVGDQTEWEVDGIPFRLVQLANHLGLDVEFLGGLGDDEKFKVIKGAKLAVMCDISQSIATMFVLEALYCGVPCITGDLPVCRDRYKDLPEYVQDVCNTGAWARKIEEVWRNLNLYTDNKGMDKQWIQENRSFKSHASGLIGVFEQCLR